MLTEFLLGSVCKLYFRRPPKRSPVAERAAGLRGAELITALMGEANLTPSGLASKGPSEYPALLSSTLFTCESRKNKEPTSGLEPLTCSLRVSSR